ncbi:MAG TPA: alpha/beta hydrolase [Ktedonobacterales bacterium]|nr:alpha/beta hydrolase [Ktedonobacterales bacterium]HEX5572679.1 alpha/beta hydrolase [Ktedonobacterales bacterium]
MTEWSDAVAGPHAGQPLLAAGEPLEQARAALLMLHGRGASAEDILSFVGELAQPGFAYLAPQASGHTWYPYGFLSPLEANEPYLSSALALLDAALDHITAAGIPLERVIVLGFSQGACLGLEYVARRARRYGGVVGWTGGLIGPDDTPRDYAGSLTGTPVFIGSSDVDPHVPLARVELTAEVLRRLGGDVTTRIYPNMPHTVNRDEIAFVRAMMASVAGG